MEILRSEIERRIATASYSSDPTKRELLLAKAQKVISKRQQQMSEVRRRVGGSLSRIGV